MDDSRKKQPDLLQTLLADWPVELADQTAVEVGLSGGLDSMVLLDVLWRCREQRHFHLSAVHVHHGLSSHADAWVAHCQSWCQARQIALRVQRVQVVPLGGESLEAVARRERYQAYAQGGAPVVALAHHQDDLAETVLLQVLRGGGPHALAAMPVLRQRHGQWLWRPLLAWPRAMLEAYAQERQLRWVTDESNADTRWRRNLLRHDVLPLLATALPDYRRHLQRSATQMAQAAQILDEVAEQDLAACLQHGRLLLARWRAFSPARQRQLLMHWLKQLQAGEVGPEALAVFCQQLLTAGADRQPALRAPNLTLFRYREQIWVLPALAVPLPDSQALSPAAPQQRSRLSGGELQWLPHERGVAAALLQQGASLRPRRGGERLLLAVGHKPVKTLLQEAGIPPLLRQRWPLLYLADGRLAAIPSVAVAQDCQGAAGLWPLWQPG